MQKRNVNELVIDMNLYPRGDIDAQTVSYLRQAHEAGAKIDPPLVCAKTLRVVDGVHRVTMYRRVYDNDHEIEVIEKHYATDAELLLDAMRLNAKHGRQLTRYDRTRCVLLAERLGVPLDEIASALSMTVEAVGALRSDRVGRMHVAKSSEDIPLKRTIRHFAGRSITKGQAEAQQKLSGMEQAFYANQLIILIDNRLLDTANERLMERLAILRDKLIELELPELAAVG